ncbi:MAG: B12-binding domain-containing radical SAM protein [Planctomycetota bacterium]|jgi:radical SAM superfamily enzyme YgiQ (UPF0313 family)
MLTLINTNRMAPLIGPIGLDYVAAAAHRAGIDVEVLDLGLAGEPTDTIKEHFRAREPELVGISFRNVDDCFWPSADWFVPGLQDVVRVVRSATNAPIAVGGVGFSIFGRSLFEHIDIDFGICGDGEQAIVPLVRQLQGPRKFADVPGLIWKDGDKICSPGAPGPSWPDSISLGATRGFVDNHRYFVQGGQCGIETKRGCNRNCIYCADPLAKGSRLRLRNPVEVADEVESLLAQGIDVLHLCDSEFNVPRRHAYAVCEELSRRSLGNRIRWYAYLSPVPFDADLAGAMARAGCVGIDFTADAGCESMLRAYRQRHSKEDLAEAVKLCRANSIAVMMDLLLGGPGETPQTVGETIDFIKQINPDCAGAALGMRIYPRTAAEKIVADELAGGKDSPERDACRRSIRRKYSGPIDLLKPTFYISEALGEHPAELVRDLIGADQRFFEPAIETVNDGDAANYNYNENLLLEQAIRKGARGAYWDILRRLRGN